MSQELMYILAGGAALNVGTDLINGTCTVPNKEAKYIGMDSSDANEVNSLIEVVRMPSGNGPDKLARGSGKVRKLNHPQAEKFVENFFTIHKPADFNVVVCSTSGGTGSMLGQVAYIWLIKHGYNAVLSFFSEHTSQAEMENSIATKRGFVAQTGKDFLNTPVVFMECVNEPGMTRGQVNAKMVQELDYLSLFLTTTNEEVDYQDIVNLLNYSKHFKVPAGISKISFHDQDSARSFKGKTPVAVCSLFGHRNDVVPLFEGCVYRATGVYNKENNPPRNITELHMILDHGETVESVKNSMVDLNDMKVHNSTKFVEAEDISTGSDNNGMFLD